MNGAQPNSPVVLDSGSLGGTGVVGTITVSDTAAPTIAPGASPGVLTSSNVIFSPYTTFEVDLPGDQLNVRGTVSLNKAILNLVQGLTLTNGQTFTIINNDGTEPIQDRFAALPDGATIILGTNKLHITYTGGSGNDVVLSVLPPIPSAIWTGGGANSLWTNPTN